MSIFLPGLSHLDTSALDEIFSMYGEISGIKRIPEGWIVEFISEESASHAFQELKGKFNMALLKKVESDPRAQVFMAGLPHTVTQGDIADALEHFGKIKGIVPSKDYWMIEFYSPEDAEKARDAINAGEVGIYTIPPPVRAFKEYLKYLKSLEGTPKYYDMLEQVGNTLRISPGTMLLLVKNY